MVATIPAHLVTDKYWAGLIHLFRNHYTLKMYFTSEFFDLEMGEIEVAKLKRKSKVWSQSEKFLLNLALHLFNDSFKVNLSDMDYLDDFNKKIAFEAMMMRSGYDELLKIENEQGGYLTHLR